MCMTSTTHVPKLYWVVVPTGDGIHPNFTSLELIFPICPTPRECTIRIFLNYYFAWLQTAYTLQTLWHLCRLQWKKEKFELPHIDFFFRAVRCEGYLSNVWDSNDFSLTWNYLPIHPCKICDITMYSVNHEEALIHIAHPWLLHRTDETIQNWTKSQRTSLNFSLWMDFTDSHLHHTSSLVKFSSLRQHMYDGFILSA